MIRKLLPLILGLTGLGLGAGAGYALRPTASPVAEEGADHGAPDPAVAHSAAAETATAAGTEYVKLSNQFVVPVLDHGRVAAMVILSLSLEMRKGASSKVYDAEPKLRDAFLQVMFDHANAGGFGGAYTDGANLIVLRKALLEAARSILGSDVGNVLIVDIMRQDG
jgi:hypothetical protein